MARVALRFPRNACWSRVLIKSSDLGKAVLEGKMGNPLEMGAGRQEGLQQLILYRTRDKPWELDLEVNRER